MQSVTNFWLWQVDDFSNVRGQVPTARLAPGVLFPDGQNSIFIFGGYSTTGFNSELFLYQPKLRVFRAAGPGENISTNSPPEPRGFFGFAATEGFIYVYGGENDGK